MHADTQNTYINTQYRYAWKRSDTRETRMRTNHVTSRACQVLMRIRAAPITRATTTKRTRAFFVSIFRSLWCSLTYRDLTTRKNAYIVFQHEGKTYIPHRHVHETFVFFMRITIITFKILSKSHAFHITRRTCNKKTRPPIDVLPISALSVLLEIWSKASLVYTITQ